MDISESIIKYRIVKVYPHITNEEELIYKYDNVQLYETVINLASATLIQHKYYIKRYKPRNIINIMIQNPTSAVCNIICSTNDISSIDKLFHKCHGVEYRIYIMARLCNTIMHICTDDVIAHYFDYINIIDINVDIMSKKSEQIIDMFIHRYIQPYKIQVLIRIPANAKYRFLQTYIINNGPVISQLLYAEVISHKSIYKDYYYTVINTIPSKSISQLLYKYNHLSDWALYVSKHNLI